MKIRPVGAELFRADRRTDMTKLTVAFRNFANAPQNTQLHVTVMGQMETYRELTKRVNANVMIVRTVSSG
jgi:hypothetical protein